MALKISSFLFITLSLLVVSARGVVPGGWRKIDNLGAPDVVWIAVFAVNEHNREVKTNLSYVRVVKGETQVVAGTNYRLVVAATEGVSANPENYITDVWSKPWLNETRLVSFKKATEY